MKMAPVAWGLKAEFTYYNCFNCSNLLTGTGVRS